MERLASKKRGWNKMVKARMDLLCACEQYMGHQRQRSENDIRVTRDVSLIVRAAAILEGMYDECGKVCSSKAALTVHQKRMPEKYISNTTIN